MASRSISNSYNHTLNVFEVGLNDPQAPIGIMLHGFGSNPHNLIPIAQELVDKVPFWLLPEGPIHLFDLLSFEAYAWFPNNQKEIKDAFLGKYWKEIRELDPPSLTTAATKIVDEIIEPIYKKYNKRPIILAGYSQGGMMTSEIILMCMRRNIQLHKVLLMSSCLVAQQRWQVTANAIVTEKKIKVQFPPIFQSHGTHDLVLAINLGKDLTIFWQQFTKVQLSVFKGAHEVPKSIIDEIREYL